MAFSDIFADSRSYIIFANKTREANITFHKANITEKALADASAFFLAE